MVHYSTCIPMQGGRKVVCGDGEGCLLLFNWGLWGDITDRFPGHPQSIDSLLATSDSVVCTGCMDGTIRWVVDTVRLVSL